MIIYAEFKLSHLVLGGLGEHFSTKMYSAPLVLGDGARISPDRLLKRLRRLDYRVAASSVPAVGEYTWTSPELKICLRGFRSPGFSQLEQFVTFHWKSDNAWSV